MRTLRQPYFLLCLGLFALNQLLEWQQLYFRPLYSHLDDLLCLPVSLSIALAAERAYFRKPAFILPKSHLVLAVVLFSAVFEVVLPYFSRSYTADILDVMAYGLGALFFDLTINKPLKTSSILV